MSAFITHKASPFFSATMEGETAQQILYLKYIVVAVVVYSSGQSVCNSKKK